MTDKELLEYAAKAVGFQIKIISIHGAYGCFTDDAVQHAYPWNPLTDDGDALRLAVKLGVDILITPYGDTTTFGPFDSPESWSSVRYVETHGDAPYAATRRAIVRAAAEIGKAMP